VTPRFPSGVGHGAMRARLESPRVCYATPGLRIGTTRASRQRQLPTKRCHAARLFGATRAYQPDSSSQPLHRQPRASVLGNFSTFTPARREPQHRLRDPARHSKPLDSWSFHISRRRLVAGDGRVGRACALAHVVGSLAPAGATRSRRDSPSPAPAVLTASAATCRSKLAMRSSCACSRTRRSVASRPIAMMP
jgi:hypothetical protein